MYSYTATKMDDNRTKLLVILNKLEVVHKGIIYVNKVYTWHSLMAWKVHAR